MKKTEMDICTTRDLYEASAIALFQKPIRLETLGNRFLFVFPKESENIASKYWTGDLQGNIRDYANSIKAMKDWIFSRKREIERNGNKRFREFVIA